ncbi:MAG: Stp1/IreP family PP2C-type Ser/Thr phosphatase [Actinomycetota bacterium]|nr:Stp1/IreP family PP2C-type Ser/Thr phosphatase [Actinomycetota bacterium]
MEYFADTDIGVYREKNEDYFYAEGNLFLVADGMGGHRAGEVASKLAIEAFVKEFSQKLPGDTEKISVDKKDKTTTSITPQKIKKHLISAVQHANEEVFKKAILQPGYYGMGTTLTGCYIYGDRAYVIHIGDSRLYIKRENKLKLLTQDHTVVGELLRRGQIGYDEAFNHPRRNYLTKVIGVAKDTEPYFKSYKILPEDIIIICSDGLNSMLRDKDILNIVNRHKQVEDIVKNLITEALRKGGLDNITVIAIKI